SHSLLKLIEDIIDISILDSGQVDINKGDINIKEFFEELTEQAEELKQDKVNIDFSINTSAHTSALDTIYTDKIRLNQILVSLLSNAFKFTDKGSIEVGYSLINQEVLQFYVSDTGVGIPKDSFGIIFEQFRQVDYEHTREFEGAGLGLALAKGLAELLGGDIRVESTLHKGSTFYFTISIKKPKAKAKPKPVFSENIEQYNFEDKTILIVEDEEMNYHYLKTVLKKTKANILWAENGKIGVEKTISNNVHIVLMDIQMPEMNGYEASRRIKELHPDLPIIAQTAHAMKEEKIKCFDAGAVEYLSKPLNRKLLLKHINKHIL
ncbi:MAG: response regulator, partial [Bacteroidota bacterium]|nr:response regulator [Bacteroidota bacterium]